jgi:hypothetical protein
MYDVDYGELFFTSDNERWQRRSGRCRWSDFYQLVPELQGTTFRYFIASNTFERCYYVV